MNRFLSAALFAAATLTAGSASALTVVFEPTLTPSLGVTKLTTANISDGQFITSVEILAPGDSAEFRYTNVSNTALKISSISFSGTGNNGGADISNVDFGLTAATMLTFPTDGQVFVAPDGKTAQGVASVNGFRLAKNATFSVFWDDGILAPVGVTTSFNTSAIPLPAAAPLLLGALGLMGLARRKARA